LNDVLLLNCSPQLNHCMMYEQTGSMSVIGRCISGWKLEYGYKIRNYKIRDSAHPNASVYQCMSTHVKIDAHRLVQSIERNIIYKLSTMHCQWPLVIASTRYIS